jgi:hypothetical protein
MRPKLTYANVMSTIAVALALAGGVAYAVTAPKNSVRSTSIVNGQVTARDLAGYRLVTRTVPINDVTPPGQFTSGSLELVCPTKRHTLVTGGGDVFGQGAGALSQSRPSIGSGKDRWLVEGMFDGDGGTLVGTAVCLSPKPGR